MSGLADLAFWRHLRGPRTESAPPDPVAPPGDGPLVLICGQSAAASGLAAALRRLRPAGVEFLGAPIAGLGREGAQSVVYLDSARSGQLWEALRTDRVDEYVLANPTDGLAVSPP